MKTNTILLVLLVIVLVVVAGLGSMLGIFRNLGTSPTTPNPNIPNPNQPVACTMDAKMCPDGSYVGRVGPNCEFAMCPAGTTTTPGTKTFEAHLNQSFGIGGANIVPKEVVED